jgi:hypothetical protein
MPSTLTVAKCREAATTYRKQAGEHGISSKKAAILRNLANSFAGLASQLQMLAACNAEERRPST